MPAIGPYTLYNICRPIMSIVRPVHVHYILHKVYRPIMSSYIGLDIQYITCLLYIGLSCLAIY